MGTRERNPEACTICRRRKRKCYEGIKGEKSCHYCIKSGKSCSYISESTETYSFEAMGNSPSTYTAQSASSTSLVEDYQDQVNSSYEAIISPDEYQNIFSSSQLLTPVNTQGPYLPNMTLSVDGIGNQFQANESYISSHQLLEHQNPQLSALQNIDHQANSPYLTSQTQFHRPLSDRNNFRIDPKLCSESWKKLWVTDIIYGCLFGPGHLTDTQFTEVLFYRQSIQAQQHISPTK